MDWYDKAKQLYPLGFMTWTQLTTIHIKGWITKEQLEEIKGMK